MPKELILITVKTYPTISTKYGELVCTVRRQLKLVADDN